MTSNYQALEVEFRSRLMGGLVGLLVGDSLGVPYEFNVPEKLPRFELIEMTPPAGFERTYSGVPPGTWSDDGAQALCLLDSLLSCGALDMDDFGARLLRWLYEGYLMPDNRVFDCGMQTRVALSRLRSGTTAHHCGGSGERDNGNGSLMRVLPLALWHRGSDAGLVRDAHAQSSVTHAHVRSQVCCAFYCLWARALLMANCNDKTNAWDMAAEKLTLIYSDAVVAAGLHEQYAKELQQILCYADTHRPQGRGYVVDALWSARQALEAGSYEDVVRTAIQFGHDTDTTACIAGGLAGIRYGIDGIPQRWKEALRGKDIYSSLLENLLARQIDMSRPPQRTLCGNVVPK